MEKIIKQIINIENKAGEITEDAKEKFLNIDSIIDKEISDLKEKLYREADERISDIKAKNRERVDREIIKLAKEREETLKKFRLADEENRQQWADKIFDNIVNSIGG